MVNNTIQGILTIDRQEMSEEQFAEFKQFTSSFFIDFKRISTLNDRELYSCICRNKELLFDSTDLEGNIIEGALSYMADRNPLLLGLWYKNGLLVGTKKEQLTENVIGEDGEITTTGTYTITGEAEYPLNKAEYIKFMPDIVVYDEEGNETSRTRPTEAKPLHKFSGFEIMNFD